MRLIIFLAVAAVAIARSQNITTTSGQWTTEVPSGQYLDVRISLYWGRLTNAIVFYGYMNIGVLSVICNGITLRVMVQRKSTSHYTYLTCLALCDFLTGVTIVGNALMASKELLLKCPMLQMISFYAQVPCYFVRYALSDSSTYVLSALSLDRLIVTKHPMHHVSWWTVRRARICCIAMVTISTILSTNVLMRLTLVWFPDRQTGIPILALSKIGRIPLVDEITLNTKFIVSQAIPLVLMCITNTWTIQQVIKGIKFRRSLSNSKVQESKVQCLGMTVGIIVIFLFTNMPTAFYLLNVAISGRPKDVSREFGLVLILTEMMRWLNTFVNFFVYVLFNKKFRQDAMRILLCRSASNANNTAVVMPPGNICTVRSL